MKFRFHEITYLDIEGKQVENMTLHKSLANALWMFSTNLDLVDKAMQINKEAEVELSGTELNAVIEVVKNPKAGFMAFAQKVILDYIEETKRLQNEAEKEAAK